MHGGILTFGRIGKRRRDYRPASLRDAPLSTTLTIRALCDLGECICSGVHVICSLQRIYLCVSMELKPEALQSQRLADKRAAAGMFAVDEAWSAAEVNRRWAQHAVLTDGEGHVLEEAMNGARGLTDVGRSEAFFEFHAMERYPESIYLQSGNTRVKIR